MERIKKIKSGRLGPDGKNLIRNQRIELSASPDEYEKLENFALKAGYNTLASYIRDTALEGLPIQGTKKTRAAEKRKLRSDLGKVGININQIAKTLNQYVLKSIVKGVDANELLAILIKSNLEQIKSDLDLIKKSLLRG